MSLKIYIDEAMREAELEEEEQLRMSKFYRRMHLDNLIKRAESVDGWHKMKAYSMTTPIPPYLASQQENYSMVQTVTRRRFSKEIAEELLAEKGDFAHFYALEKLESGGLTTHTELWRDVLIWLDELKGEEK